MQRRTAMAAHVQQRRSMTLAVAIQYHGLVADASGQGRPGDLVGPGCDVPGVAHEHRCLPIIGSTKWHRPAGPESSLWPPAGAPGATAVVCLQLSVQVAGGALPWRRTDETR